MPPSPSRQQRITADIDALACEGVQITATLLLEQTNQVEIDIYPLTEPSGDPATSAEPIAPATSAEPSPAYVPSGPPTIASDQADYPPGARVTLTGANWAGGEVVHIYVNDTLGNSWSRNVDVTASDAGLIVDSFWLPTWFIADYTVVATGPISGTATIRAGTCSAAVVNMLKRVDPRTLAQCAAARRQVAPGRW